jgi:hypothetical protein
MQKKRASKLLRGNAQISSIRLTTIYLLAVTPLTWVAKHRILSEAFMHSHSSALRLARISIVEWSQVLNQYQRRADLILAQHFPPGALPRNELPNTLAEIEGPRRWGRDARLPRLPVIDAVGPHVGR